MERLKAMKESLIGCVQGQINGNLKDVDAKELGEAVDMIKDLEEAIYYATITKAMGEKEKEEYRHYYTSYPQYYMPMDYKGDMEWDREKKTRMYYGGDGNGGNGSMTGGNGGNGGRYGFGHKDYEYPIEMRDYREGRSPRMRRSYMESKEMHKDAKVKMNELEKYMKELSEDIVEMIEDASPEEKQLLKAKLTTLSGKINV